MTTNDLLSYDMKAANENMKNNLPKPMGSSFADLTNNSSTAPPDHKFHDAEGEAIEMAEIEVVCIANMSGSGRFSNLPCTFCMSHDVGDARPSIGDSLRGS